MVADRVDPGPATLALDEARRSGGGWFRAECPYCLERTGKADKRRSLGIKPSIEFFMCLKCGVRGRLRLGELAVASAYLDEPDLGEAHLGPPDGFEPLWDADNWSSLTFEDPVAYLRGRGVTQQIAHDAGIGAVLGGFLASRIVVPIIGLDDSTWLGYSARDWTGRQEPKYRYPIGMQRAKFLYNQQALYEEVDEPVIVVEGVFDALPYWPDAVACLGKPGHLHKQLMAEARRPIAVCLDGDAWEESWALSNWLRMEGKTSGYVHLPPCTDPNNVDHAWLREEARRCLSS